MKPLKDGPKTDALKYNPFDRKKMPSEAVSKPWIRLEGKAQVDEKAEHTRVGCEHFEETCNAAVRPQTRF